MTQKGQNIYLELPISKEYAHLLRLTVSGIASRMNFNLDAVDDLKIAVEEAYLMAISCCTGETQGIIFNIKEDSLEIIFKDLIRPREELSESQRKEQDYGLFIIEAVVDELEKSSVDGCDLRFVKRLK